MREHPSPFYDEHEYELSVSGEENPQGTDS